MSSTDKPPFFNLDEEDDFLIPPGQPGSMMNRLAPDDGAWPRQLEFVFAYSWAEWEVVRVDTDCGVFLELGRKRS